MKHLPLRDLICASLFAVGALYGTWGLFTEVVRTIVPFGLLLVLLLTAAGYFLRVPAPSSENVEAIIGKDPSDVGPTETGYVMKTVAHRGAGLDCPENSLAAFKMCADKGCDAIEFDVTLTKDEVPIVFHDESLERMAELKMNVADQDWSEISNVDISVKHVYRERFAKTNIPTLEQTVTQLLGAGQRMFIDIKDNNMKMVKIIHELFKQHPDLYSRAVVSSFFPNIIYFVRKGDPKIVCAMAWRPNCHAYDSYNYPTGKGAKISTQLYKHYFLELCDIVHEWALTRIIYYFVGISIILLHKDVVSGRDILRWRKKGLRVIAWSVNSPAEKQYLAKVLKITYLTDTLTGEATTHSPPL